MNVNIDTSTMVQTLTLRSALLALGMLEKHIVAMIIGAKEELNLGTEIIEKLAENINQP